MQKIGHQLHELLGSQDTYQCEQVLYQQCLQTTLPQGSSQHRQFHLSNNTITGTFPAMWGDKYHESRQSLQRLYLDNNGLTSAVV